MQIKELFNIISPQGLAYTNMTEQKGGIPFVCRSGKNNGVAGYVAPVNNLHPIDAPAITVPMSGSVLECFYQDKPFYTAYHVASLRPKINLTIREMFYYVCVIRQYKDRYNYGRQANRTLAELEVPSPDEIPSWVYEMEIPTFDDISEAKTAEKVELPPVDEWKSFKYSEIFNIKKATGPKISEVKKTEGNVPYVSATAENNGIAHYGNFTPTSSGNCLTVGHLGDCFYQGEAFAGSNATILNPKFELNAARAMFLVSLINANKFKYNYGRVIGIARLKEETISLPVTADGTPNWQLMEDYINSLPYSKYL